MQFDLVCGCFFDSTISGCVLDRVRRSLERLVENVVVPGDVDVIDSLLVVFITVSVLVWAGQARTH